ncbi:MAG TPA: hypothetical protein VHP32_08740 [Ignavibacteria bacterium]|jgi:hypothetical protein|nr:hypothetical protein [Ignavibacteria bacterium]
MQYFDINGVETEVSKGLPPEQKLNLIIQAISDINQFLMNYEIKFDSLEDKILNIESSVASIDNKTDLFNQ